jgi:cell pole-organizing protein PopZ
MAARNLFLGMALVLGGVACGSSTPEPKLPETTTVAPAPVAVRAPDPPPAVPPSLAAQPPAPAVEAPAAAPAPLPAPGLAEVEADARAQASMAAKEKAKWAKAAHDADRKGTEEWSREHVQKATARVSQLQTQVSRIPPMKRGKYNTDMAAFSTRKAEVLSRINSLNATGTDEWKTAKAALDRAIEDLDAALARLENDF